MINILSEEEHSINIKDYQKKKTVINVKIGLFGDTNVGKTSIFNILNNKEFNINNIQHHTTIGVDFIIKTYVINDVTFKLHIWDTAGQERYNSIIKQYYNVDIPIFIFDVNNITSFNNMNKWIMNHELNHIRKPLFKILLGNKLDLKLLYNMSDLNLLIIQNNLTYYNNTNKDTNNIKHIFNKIVYNIYEMYIFNKLDDFYINTTYESNKYKNFNYKNDDIENCC